MSYFSHAIAIVLIALSLFVVITNGQNCMICHPIDVDALGAIACTWDGQQCQTIYCNDDCSECGLTQPVCSENQTDISQQCALQTILNETLCIFSTPTTTINPTTTMTYTTTESETTSTSSTTAEPTTSATSTTSTTSTTSIPSTTSSTSTISTTSTTIEPSTSSTRNTLQPNTTSTSFYTTSTTTSDKEEDEIPLAIYILITVACTCLVNVVLCAIFVYFKKRIGGKYNKKVKITNKPRLKSIRMKSLKWMTKMTSKSKSSRSSCGLDSSSDDEENEAEWKKFMDDDDHIQYPTNQTQEDGGEIQLIQIQPTIR